MPRFDTVCLSCDRAHAAEAVRCAACGGMLGFSYDDAHAAPDDRFRESMWRWWRLLPIADPNTIVSLGEGATPLIESRVLPRTSFKDESRNPTGSHKDRPLAVAISHANALGRELAVVASAGSTGIANAAMAARAGMRSVALVPRDTPTERLYPVFALGSTVVVVDEAVDSVLDRLAEMADGGEIYVSSTVRGSNPYQAEGTKTIAYELAEHRVPDWVAVPVGGGGTVAGIWRGFCDLQRLGRIDRVPRLLGVVARGYNAIEIAFQSGLEDPLTVFPAGHAAPETGLVKIAHVYPPDGAEGLAAVRRSGGAIVSVSDDDAFDAQQRLARDEGLYVEPSAAVSVAGLARARADGIIDEREEVVAILSGSGFRETFLSAARRPLQHRTISLDEISSVLAEQLAGPAR